MPLKILAGEYMELEIFLAEKIYKQNFLSQFSYPLKKSYVEEEYKGFLKKIFGFTFKNLIFRIMALI